jgi:hypothetical protein
VCRLSHTADSFDVYTITREGRAVIGGLFPGLLVGALSSAACHARKERAASA